LGIGVWRLLLLLLVVVVCFSLLSEAKRRIWQAGLLI
jgi:hypothetical protein